MKKLILATLLLASVFACKKDKSPSQPESVDGYWIGTWMSKNSSSQNEMAVVLRNNGTARILYGYSGGDTASAYYVTEDRFSYNDGIVMFQSRESDYIYSYRGQVSGNSISGTWGELPSYDDGGTWTMNKQ